MKIQSVHLMILRPIYHCRIVTNANLRATAMKRMQQQCFAEMKKLLQDIKEAKKKATAQ